ncbi:MAG: sigma-70 family RNA polymerase sigma factor [Bacteroidetes bacterium]|nr:sigma-70 family RNA polymerase sigma factor [Bacteroidota bacterium]
MTPGNTAELVTRCKKGDQQAFAGLVRQHYEFAYSLAFRMLCHHEEARDAVQEVFLRVWQNIHRFDENTRFTTWLYRIVANRCLDALRMRARRPPGDADRGEERDLRDPADPATPETLACSADIARAIHRLTAGLPEVQRLVFTLRDLQDLSIAEVQHVTGLSSQSIRTNLHLARKRIRERLEDEYAIQGGEA